MKLKAPGITRDYGQCGTGRKQYERFFVVGGNGTGAKVYWSLSRLGYGMASGVLHVNDIDAQVARGSAVKSSRRFRLKNQSFSFEAGKGQIK